MVVPIMPNRIARYALGAQSLSLCGFD